MTEEEKQKRTYRKTEFFNFDLGIHRIRILTPMAVLKFMHFLKRKYAVECLGGDCPVCSYNKDLIQQYPDNFRDQPGYNGKSRRHYVNVLDRTEVKVCTNCGEETKADMTGAFPNVCSACGTIITEVTPAPSNRVKVMSASETFMSQLVGFEQATKDKNGEPLGWCNFDFQIMVNMVNKRKNPTPSPDRSATDSVEELYNEEDLFDLDKALIHLEADEIKDLLKGVSLSDIFKARRASDVNPVMDNDDVDDEDIEARVAELFGENN